MNYEHQYTEYDELSPFAGPKCIRCQCCEQEIVARHYMELEIKSDPPRKEKVLCMVKLNNYARKPMALSDGSFINLFMCTDCEKNEVVDFDSNPEKCAKIIAQLKNDFMQEDRNANKNEADVKEYAKRWDGMKALKTFSSDLPRAEVIKQTKEASDKFREKQKGK